MSIGRLFRDIDKNKSCILIVKEFIDNISNYNINPVQILSLLCHVILKDAECIGFVKSQLVLKEINVVKPYLDELIYLIDNNNYFECGINFKLYNQIELDISDIKSIVAMSLIPEIHSFELTIILNLIKFKGLSTNNIYSLSLEMANSGQIFDYRNDTRFGRKCIIRRYPTGGVSEKISLILPSLLKYFSSKYDFVSTCLVAKSLGYTGGTWDKLSSIPGFSFPNPGDDTVKILAIDNVCMTVAKGEFAPSDTNLYQLRSITNTVNSLPLIISSIASKQIANPVDLLLLDIRYGENAIFSTKEYAIEFYYKINSILEKFDINVIPEYTNSSLLNGYSIGNYLEVLESICIMRNQQSYSSIPFDVNVLKYQRDLVVLMAAKLISYQFKEDINRVIKACNEAFYELKVYESFKELLLSHGVKDEVILTIEANKFLREFETLNQHKIISNKNGILKNINQKNIGDFVNLELKTGINVFSNLNRLYDGFLLKKHMNSNVRKGEIIGVVFCSESCKNDDFENLFFEIV